MGGKDAWATRPRTRASPISTRLSDQPSVDRLRDFGFSKGFGVENSDWKQYGHETDKRVVGHQWGRGEEAKGRAAMETLLQKDPNINLVYTINEPTAAGAYGALRAADKDDALIVSVDGGCPGVKNVAAGVIGATSQQYPLLMASKGDRGRCRIRQDRQEAGADARVSISSTPASRSSPTSRSKACHRFRPRKASPSAGAERLSERLRKVAGGAKQPPARRSCRRRVGDLSVAAPAAGTIEDPMSETYVIGLDFGSESARGVTDRGEHAGGRPPITSIPIGTGS